MMTTALIAILVGGLSFFGGVKYQQNKRQNYFIGGPNGPMMQGRFDGRGGSGARGMMRGGFRPVTGEIISSDGTSITVKLSDGSSKIVLVSQATDVNKADKAEKTDLIVGAKVMVMGTENSDGSITAQNIQLNPMMRMFGPSGTPKP